MHPTVLYCSPMKERDEALQKGRKRIQGKESWESTAKSKAKYSICYANVSKLLFLLCQLR